MEFIEKLFIIYLLLFSAVLFILMAVDKHSATKGLWRIPERSLILIALLGGAVGGILGMLAFRHKTKHKKFTVGFPICLIVNIAAAFAVFYLI